MKIDFQLQYEAHSLIGRVTSENELLIICHHLYQHAYKPHTPSSNVSVANLELLPLRIDDQRGK